MEKVAVVGESFGGSLAPIAASREHRLAAVISIDGLYSIQEATFTSLPSEMMHAFEAGNATLFKEVTYDIYGGAVEGKLGDESTEVSWFIDQGLWPFDVISPFTWFTDPGYYTLNETYANVTCPIFIGDGQNDTVVGNQAEVAWQSLGDPSKRYYYEFANTYGAGEHCQIGAEPYMNMVVWDSLEGVYEGNWAKGNGTAFF